MSEQSLERLCRELDSRSGANRVLRALGFPDMPRRVPVPTGSSMRCVSRTDRRTLAAYHVELRGDVTADDVRAAARTLRNGDGTRHHVLLVTGADWSRFAIGCDAPVAGTRSIVIDRAALRDGDVDVLRELAPEPGEGDSAAALRIMRALDRSRAGDRFFRDVVAVRNRIALCWTGVPFAATAEREALALLLLSRLMFLYFLQRRGLLAGNTAYLPDLLRAWLRSGPRRTTFYRTRLRALFFGALNRRPERRSRAARALGRLPYLNGGLFEVHRLEKARPGLDLPDDAVAGTFRDLLEKYRFTATHPAAASASDAGGVDPEMLGRIFEGLMPGERRDRTGTFYTPADTVDRVVANALTLHLAAVTGVPPADLRAVFHEPHGEAGAALPAPALESMRSALRQLRVLDPACGSGAFLLGALSRITELRRALEPAAVDAVGLRREAVAHTLHGVDILEDAALICSLRLWLTLVPQCEHVDDVPPLPNLDRRIRQGDALVDPLDVGSMVAARPLDTTAPPELRPLTARLAPLANAYLGAGPEAKTALRAQLASLERAVARTWLAALERRLDWEERDLAARADDRDLFGSRPAHADVATRRLPGVRRRRAELAAFSGEVSGPRRLPFFSFRVHFAEAQDGFDLVLSNPPWIRSHRWPPATRTLLRERYVVCADAGWPAAARLVGTPAGAGSQVDLSLLFLERSIGLLRRGGTLAMLLPAKLFRSLYAGGARQLLIRTMRVAAIEDHSLDHRTIFDADAFTAVLLARRPDEQDAPPAPVRVSLRRHDAEPLDFCVPVDDLPLRRDDHRSPWLLVPPGCRDAIHRMQCNGRELGRDVVIRRGVMTGANEVMVVRDAEPKLGDIARIRTEGFHRAATAQGRNAYAGWVEASALRPALRGTDISAWRATPARHVLWTPYNDDPQATAPPRLRRFLRRHRSRLRQPDHAIGALQRLSPLTLGHKVVWSDLAADLRAAAVPANVRAITGLTVPIVPLNSAYFIAARNDREALLLAAYLNSLPLRVHARAIAERAKDAHFRFFAWTVAVLPLPSGWQDGPVATRLVELSATAHDRGGMTEDDQHELDSLVASAFGLTAADRTSLAHFDRWLTGAGKEADR